jgi:hypothetical protein
LSLVAEATVYQRSISDEAMGCKAGLGAIRLDRLDREDVARWLDEMASAGQLSWRSIQICRTV